MRCNGCRASVLSPVILKAMAWPWWLMGRWSLKPKNGPMVVQPRWASLRNTLLPLMRALWQTASLVLSTK